MAVEQICIYKLSMEKIMEYGNSIDGYTDEQAIMCGELVPISTSQLTGKIYDYYSEKGLGGLTVKDAIVNIVVPTANGKNAKKVAEAYSELAHHGFDLNGRHYVRLCAGSDSLGTIQLHLYGKKCTII